MPDAVCAGRKYGKSIHISYIQAAVGRSIERTDRLFGHACPLFITGHQAVALAVIPAYSQGGSAQPYSAIGSLCQGSYLKRAKRLAVRICQCHGPAHQGGFVQRQQAMCRAYPDTPLAIGQQAPHGRLVQEAFSVAQRNVLKAFVAGTVSGQGAVRIAKPQMAMSILHAAQHGTPFGAGGGPDRHEIQFFTGRERSGAAHDAFVIGGKPKIALVIVDNRANLIVPVLIEMLIQLVAQIRPDAAAPVCSYPQDAVRIVIHGYHPRLDVPENGRRGIVEDACHDVPGIILVQRQQGIAVPRDGQVFARLQRNDSEHVRVGQPSGHPLVYIRQAEDAARIRVIADDAVREGGHPDIAVVIIEQMIDPQGGTQPKVDQDVTVRVAHVCNSHPAMFVRHADRTSVPPQRQPGQFAFQPLPTGMSFHDVEHKGVGRGRKRPFRQP